MSNETTSLELSLIRAEKINAYLVFIAVILGIISLNISERQLLEKESQSENPDTDISQNVNGSSTRRNSSAPNQQETSSAAQQQNLLPTILSALAGWILVISNIIGVSVAGIRFREVSERVEEGDPDAPNLEPVSLLTLGVYIGFVSSILSALGAQQKVEEEQETVVITPL